MNKNEVTWAVSIAAIVLLCNTLRAQTYRLTDLGYLPGFWLGEHSFAQGINASGKVVGYGYVANGNHAFYWDAVGGIRDLGDLPGGYDSSEAYSINAAGQIVGSGYVAGSGYQNDGHRAILWDAAGVMHDLSQLPGWSSSSLALDINDAGQIVGSSSYAAANRHAFLWDPVAGMRDLGDLPGGKDHSAATALNAVGQVVGASEAATGTRAFRWDAVGGMRDLGDLPGGKDYSIATAINAAGQVVGESAADAIGNSAFLWDPVHGMRNLGGLLREFPWSTALDINDTGQVVGRSLVDDYRQASDQAFLWDAVAGMRNLNDLLDETGAGWELAEARAINNAGQIIGYGWTPTRPSGQHAFLLTPNVPEPSTLSLLLLPALSLLRRPLSSKQPS